MKIGITYEYLEKYLPNKRCRNARKRLMVTTYDATVNEVKFKDFPVAFIIHDYKERDGEFKLCADEIRTYNSKLYMLWRVESGKDVGRLQDVSDLMRHLKWLSGYEYEPYYKNDKDKYSEEKSIIIGDNKNIHTHLIQEAADKFLKDEYGNIWEETGEPVYHILTFGLGHNHGGTGFFIDYHYNPNCSANSYFTALQFDEAVEYFKNTALGRGDTESWKRFNSKEKYIEVIMPEMVKRNPAEEHADGGNSFIDAIEAIIDSSSSSNEAGLVAMATTVAMIN